MLRSYYLISVCILLLSVQTFGQSLEEKYETSEDIITLDELSNLRQMLPEFADSVITILENDYDTIIASANENIKNRTHYLLGISYYYKGLYLVSNYYYDQVLNALMSGGDSNNQLLEAVYNNKGVNLELLGHYENSIEIYLESLNIARSRDDTLGIGQTTLNLGVLFFQLQDTTKAIDYTREALDYFHQVDDTYHIALGNMNYGSFIQRSEPEKGIEFLENALESFIRLNDSYRIAETLYHQAINLLVNQNFDEAVEKALLSLEYNPAAGFINLKITTYNILIDSYYQMSEPEKALPYIEEIHEAIEMKDIQSVQALEYFWEKSEKVLSNPEYTELLDYQNALKKEFIQDMERSRYSNIVAQFEILSNLEEGYADSLQQKLNEIENDDKNNYTLVLLWALILLVWAGYLFRGYLPLPGQDSRTDYLIQKIKNQKVDEEDIQAGISVVETSGCEHLDKGKRQTDSVSKLFPEIDELMMKEQLFKNPDLSREYLAKRLHTNTKYISIAVKQETGLSFKDYINSCAISLAVSKIKDTNSSLTNMELAEECGYSSEATFYRNFKKLTGLTPNQFKERYHGEKAH
ncbi:MAG: tetratricopeptide repeat protein [Balneolaceae bacterium]|nr:tetratricopeptide repeat protein [Balneolaceae bacterium]MDR9408301.1 tetratricopeptide repeat protein [Balneolaceae bacterium]